MPRSQNGYSANDRSLVHNPVVPGTNVTLPGGVRKGAAGDLILWVFEQFHRRVEPLRPGWCWGYAERKIRDGDDLSNHASGTAGDANAPEHPLGKRGTFTPAKTREIRSIVAETEGCVRWGGDYDGRADEMHFEIVKPEADCARVLAKLRRQAPTEEDDMAQFTDGHAKMLADLHHYYVTRDWANLPDQPPGTGTAMEMLSQIHEVLTAPIGSEVDKGKTQATLRQFVGWIDKASHETRTELRSLAAEVIDRLDRIEGTK